MKQKLKKKDKEVVSSGPWYQQNLHILRSALETRHHGHGQA